MSAAPIHGRARVLGDDVNTDYLISSTRKKESLDPQVLRRYLLEDLDPAFAASVRPGDLLVAGDNFGCGSAMEVAVSVVIGAGIRAVVARGFSRTYARNAVNNGLLLVTADTRGIAEGEPLAIRLDGGRPTVTVGPPPGRVLQGAPISDFVLALRAEGGLVPYLRRHRRLA